MVDGQRIHRVIGRESEGVTRTQAEEFIEVKRTEAREGRLAPPRGRKLHLTFAAASELYLKRLNEIGGKDYTNNEQHLRIHLNPYLGSMQPDRISPFTLQKFRAHCSKTGLSDSTINRVLATYRRMSRRLVKWRVVPNPLPAPEPTTERNARDYVISEDEETRLLEAALASGSPYLWLFIKIGLATSLRHSEILSAKFDGFDAGRRRLTVRVKGSAGEGREARGAVQCLRGAGLM
jgi:integrase